MGWNKINIFKIRESKFMGITQKHHKVLKLWMKKSYKNHTSKKGLQIMCFNRQWKLKACTKAFILVQVIVVQCLQMFSEIINESKVAINIFYGICAIYECFKCESFFKL
jgi:hypothetical protein